MGAKRDYFALLALINKIIFHTIRTSFYCDFTPTKVVFSRERLANKVPFTSYNGKKLTLQTLKSKYLRISFLSYPLQFVLTNRKKYDENIFRKTSGKLEHPATEYHNNTYFMFVRIRFDAKNFFKKQNAIASGCGEECGNHKIRALIRFDEHDSRISRKRRVKNKSVVFRLIGNSRNSLRRRGHRTCRH